jgi:hypothetical protein
MGVWARAWFDSRPHRVARSYRADVRSKDRIELEVLAAVREERERK